MRKFFIIGANGQLGSDIVRVFDKECTIPLTHNDIEITDINSIRVIFNKFNPNFVINTAGFHNVTECDKNPLRAFEVNAIGIKNLALCCKDKDAVLVHISTNYVFDGKKGSPYFENDVPCPINTYGITKLCGEYYIKSILDKYFIVRTSGLYGKNPCRAKGYNFVALMLKLSKEKEELKVVDDEILSPTYTLDLAYQIHRLILSTHAFGLYHITNEGEVSWYEFALSIFNLLGIKVNLKPSKTVDSPNNVKRPKYSVLENHNLKAVGIYSMRHWKEALVSYLKEIRLL